MTIKPNARALKTSMGLGSMFRNSISKLKKNISQGNNIITMLNIAEIKKNSTHTEEGFFTRIKNGLKKKLDKYFLFLKNNKLTSFNIGLSLGIFILYILTRDPSNYSEYNVKDVQWLSPFDELKNSFNKNKANRPYMIIADLFGIVLKRVLDFIINSNKLENEDPFKFAPKFEDFEKKERKNFDNRVDFKNTITPKKVENQLENLPNSKNVDLGEKIKDSKNLKDLDLETTKKILDIFCGLALTNLYELLNLKMLLDLFVK